MSNDFIPGMVSAKDVGDMKRLVEIMNGMGGSDTGAAPVAESYSYDNDVDPNNPYLGNTPVAPPVLSSGAGNGDADAMKKILESFYGASGGATQTLREEAAFDPKVKEALQTRATSEGVQIGKWEIRAKLTEGSKTRKEYAVANPATGERVVEKLVVYEAAQAIVRLLNRGYDFEARKIQEVISLEEQFFRNRQDASRFKQRFDRCIELGEQAAADVFEARYQQARAHALAAQDQIKGLLESIR